MIEKYGSLPKDPHEWNAQDCDVANQLLEWLIEQIKDLATRSEVECCCRDLRELINNG